MENKTKTPSTKPTIGETASATVTVTQQQTANIVGSGSADVFATPMMIALMERAACETLSNSLEAHQTSVGTGINVSHNAASPIGAVITATATIISIDGRKIDFTVTARDNAGEIGSGIHSRVIVDEGKFLARAAERIV